MRKIEFKIIQNSDYSDEIRNILDEEEMESLVQVKYEKVPNLFESLHKDSEKTPIIVVGIDTENDNLVGVGACSIFKNNIGYLNSFRIKKEYRNKVNFGKAYKMLITEAKKCGVKTVITTILEENKVAQRILTKRRKSMPIYEFYKNIVFFSLKNVKKGDLAVNDEEILNYGNFEKVVGLCNIPVHTQMDCASLYEKDISEFKFQFAGLNHFVWYKVWDKKGNELTADLWDKRQDKENLGVKNIVSINYDYDQIKNLGMLPCDYHRYYYLQDEMLAEGLKSYKENGTRGEIVKRVEAELFELYKDVNLKEKPKQLEQRGGAYYSDAACELISAIYNDKGIIMAVNTRNKGAIADLPYNSAVEISSYITANGPKPITFGKFPNAGQRGYIQLMKAMEELTVEAAVTGNYYTALQAFTINPLVPGTTIGRKVLNELLDAHEKYLPQFRDYYENREKYRK